MGHGEMKRNKTIYRCQQLVICEKGNPCDFETLIKVKLKVKGFMGGSSVPSGYFECLQDIEVEVAYSSANWGSFDIHCVNV